MFDVIRVVTVEIKIIMAVCWFVIDVSFDLARWM